jgi:hypothetical protein
MCSRGLILSVTRCTDHQQRSCCAMATTAHAGQPDGMLSTALQPEHRRGKVGIVALNVSFDTKRFVSKRV